MKLTIKIKTGQKSSEIIKDGEDYIVKVKSQPHENKANEELIKLISKFFKTPISNIKIKSGTKSKRKIIEII